MIVKQKIIEASYSLIDLTHEELCVIIQSLKSRVSHYDSYSNRHDNGILELELYTNIEKNILP